MCRWLAYAGSPVRLEELLYKPKNSLVVQGRHSRLGAEAINGDGFGVGWYDADALPGLFRSTDPVWSDQNLRELCAHARAARIFAHIRASTGTAVQQTNCHPFRHGRWLWMHNGAITGFRDLKRDLAMEVRPDLYPAIEGSTDSEHLFYLALSYGLENDPRGAVAKTIGLVERCARDRGIPFPVQMTVATTDGEAMWAFRYSSEGRSRSLFRSADVSTLRKQYPDKPELHELSDDSRLVVSEPLGDLRGAWHEVPESSCLVVRPDKDELLPFAPDMQ